MLLCSEIQEPPQKKVQQESKHTQLSLELKARTHLGFSTEKNHLTNNISYSLFFLQRPSLKPLSSSMADEIAARGGENPNTRTSLLRRLMSKRRTWVFLFVLVYGVLLSSSWNLLHSILFWYNSNTSSSDKFSGWPALYASVLLGAVFGILSMAAALAVAIPATVMTWITVLVLLTFCGKPRKALVVEGMKITTDISGFVIKILLKEGNIVAAVCAVVGYLALVRKSAVDD